MTKMSLIPLESNPEVMTKFIHKIGVPTKWKLSDVYGLDEPLLAMVPQPVLALILLFPETEKAKAYDAELEHKIQAEEKEPPKNVFHMKQCVTNACGTVALIHSILNNLEQIDLNDGALKNFYEEAKDLSFVERGELLTKESNGIIEAHKQLAQEGQTQAPPEDEPVVHHFVAFVEKDGTLYELDGCKSAPINHGPTTKETVLDNAAKICKEYMARDPGEVHFTMMALVAN